MPWTFWYILALGAAVEAPQEASEPATARPRVVRDSGFAEVPRFPLLWAEKDDGGPALQHALEAWNDGGTGEGSDAAARPLVERFDRRGIEPFELFSSELGQNAVRIFGIRRKPRSKFCKNSGNFARIHQNSNS